jgi:hypothetical protein
VYTSGLPSHLWQHVLDVEPNRHLQQLGEVRDWVGIGVTREQKVHVMTCLDIVWSCSWGPAKTAHELTRQPGLEPNRHLQQLEEVRVWVGGKADKVVRGDRRAYT